MKKLLVHACCGPCFVYPHSVLKNDAEIGAIHVYYFNPNIHPSMEYLRRLEALTDYCDANAVELRVGEYSPAVYLRAVAGNEDDRCRLCYSIRLGETARYAAEHGYDIFTTTLSVSPYQDHDLIRSVGDEAGERFGVEFVYRDFRDGFREGQSTAKELGMYRQPYCGCIYSEHERYAKKLEAVTASANRRI